MVGTSDQSCWLAEACKNPSLEGLWMYGVTVYLDRSYGTYSNTCALERQAPTFNKKNFQKPQTGYQVQMWLPWFHLEVLDTGSFTPVGQQVSMEQLFCLCGSDTAEKEHQSFSSKTNDQMVMVSPKTLH